MHKSYHTIAYVKINSCAAPGRRMGSVTFENKFLFSLDKRFSVSYLCRAINNLYYIFRHGK